jgi:transposase
LSCLFSFVKAENVAQAAFGERKIKIIGNYMANNSFSETGRLVGRSKSVVYRVVKRFNEENSLCNNKKSWTTKTNKREDRSIVRMETKNRFLSARKLLISLMKRREKAYLTRL